MSNNRGFGKTSMSEEMHVEQNPDLRRWLRDHPDGGRWVGVNEWKHTYPFKWQGKWLSILNWNGYEDRHWIEVMDPLTKSEVEVSVPTSPDKVQVAVNEVCCRLSEIHYNDLLATNLQLHAWDAWLTRHDESPSDKCRTQMARGLIDLYEQHQIHLPGRWRYRFAALVNELVREEE